MRCKNSDLPRCKLVLLLVWISIVTQLIYSNLRPTTGGWQEVATDRGTVEGPKPEGDPDSLLAGPGGDLAAGEASRGFGFLFAEAGKKKKKEKSEVVVISVQNPPQKAYGSYPVFIPSCGGGGFGRRKRSLR